MQVRVEAPLRPTEDPERVEAAVTRFLPEAQVQHAPTAVTAHGGSLDALRKRVWELRIIDTFRGPLLAGAQGMRLTFRISKQAAFAGRVSIPPTPHPLGELSWTVDVEDGDPWADAEALAWWLCPETKDGEVVGPVD